ncbi:MAG: helix-turn-helix domain-containing protein [Clostridium sp.]|nr:helix-turn-helix domain-containing protein [Clostridium sp.]
MNILHIGGNLRILREKRQLTQEELGKEIALSASAVSNIENTISFPSIDTLIKLVEFFEVDVDYFLNESNKELAEIELKVKLRTAEEFLRNGENRSLQIISPIKQYRLEESEEILLYEVKNL